MKRFLLTILMLGAYAALNVFPIQAENTLSIGKEDAQMLRVDGAKSSCEVKWNDSHNRLMVDSMFVTEYFGASVTIDGNNIDIFKNDHRLHMESGNEFYIMDNLGGRQIDTPAEINNGKAYLPLRYICEAFGASVQYDGTTQTVDITTNANIIDDSIKAYFENVQVFDQSTIRITGEKTIYFDPRQILTEPHDADAIFITHTHQDHYEIASIKRLIKDSTVVYIPENGVEQAKADGLENVVGVVPNKDYEENGIIFTTVPAYNNSSERQNHKKEYNWVGYIVTANGRNYYSAGDTDFIDEMKNITKPIDVAFLPIDGKFNMGVEESANAANAISPKIAVPYHYDNFHSENEAEKFIGFLDENIKGAIASFKMQ